MITIYVENDAQRARAEAAMKHRIWHDPEFSGAEYKIERDDCAWIDGCDEIAGSILLSEITSGPE